MAYRYSDWLGDEDEAWLRYRENKRKRGEKFDDVFVKPKKKNSTLVISKEPPPTNIIENIWIGNLHDAMTWKGPRLCVLETKEDCRLKKKDDYWSPILEHEKLPSGAQILLGVPQEKLDKAASKLEEIRKTGKNVLTHCYQGWERSPLTVVWWLHKYRNMSVPKAYELVQSKRDVVIDRSKWIIGYEHSSEDSEAAKWREFKRWMDQRKAER